MSNPYFYNAMVTDPNCITDPMTGNILVPQQFKSLSTSECQEQCGQWVKVNCPNTDPGENPCQSACTPSPGPPTGLDGGKVYQNNCSHISVAGGNENLLDDCCNTHCNKDPACKGDCVNASTGGGAPIQGCNPCTNLTSDKLSECCGASQEQVCMQMYKQNCPPGCYYNQAAGECMGGNSGPAPTTKPTKPGCYSFDGHNYFNMDENNPNDCHSPNIWIGPSPPTPPPSPPSPPKPVPTPTPSPKLDVPNDWTKKFYDELVSLLKSQSDGLLNQSQLECVINKAAKQYKPPQLHVNDENPPAGVKQFLETSVKQCMSSTPSDPGKPNFVSSEDDKGKGKDSDGGKKNDHNVLIISLVIVGVLLILGGAYALSRHNKSTVHISAFY